MSMVQTFTDGSNYLTQGFQQPEVVTVGINEIPVDPLTTFWFIQTPQTGVLF